MTGEDDVPRSVRDFRLMARAGFWVVVGICTVISAIVAHFLHEERQDHRIDSAEKWQANRDKQALEDARREWLRDMDRDRVAPGSPK